MSSKDADSARSKLSYTWTIKKFNERAKKDIVSEEFSSERSKWQILVGYRETHLAMFLEMTKSELSDGVPTLVKFSLLNTKREVHTNSFNHIYFPGRHSPGYTKFVEKAVLHSKDNDLLVDDILTVYCEIDALENVDSIKTPPGDLHHNLKKLFISKEFSDVSITINDEEIRAHKAILAARSPIFKAMFSNDMKENQLNCVEITDMEPDVIKEMIKFMYTDNIVLKLKQNVKAEKDNYETDKREHLAIELLKAADRYQLDRLKVICEKALSNTISTDSFLEILSLAQQYSASQLKNQVIKFMCTSLEEVIVTDSWTRFSRDEPALAIELVNRVISRKSGLRKEFRCIS